jgi:hypothetical protein
MLRNSTPANLSLPVNPARDTPFLGSEGGGGVVTCHRHMECRQCLDPDQHGEEPWTLRTATDADIIAQILMGPVLGGEGIRDPSWVRRVSLPPALESRAVCTHGMEKG